MPTSSGPNIINDSSIVFNYDIGDLPNSYRGEPTTNLVSDPDGNANVITTDVPVGTNVMGFARYGDGYYVNPRGTTNTSATGNTFTYSVYMRSQSSPASTYLMYVFTGTGPDGGWYYFGDGSLTSDWRRYTYTRSDMTGTVSTVTVYRYNQQGIIDIAAPQIEIKPIATQFTKGTRSSTQGLLDISGRGNAITLANMTYGANNAISFDGTDDYLGLSSNIQSGFTAATYEFFCRPASLPGSGNYFQLYIQETSTWIALYNVGFGAFFGIDLNNGSGWFDNNGGSNTGARTNDPLVANTWYHVVFSWESGVVRCYLNGALQSTVSTAQAANGRQNVMSLGSGTTHRNIGSRYSGGGNNWVGNIPIVKFYDRGLTATEVLNNYTELRRRFDVPVYTYSEGNNASLYLSNWNNSTTYTMADFGGLPNVTAHGFSSGPVTYTLTLNNLPPHTRIRYKVYWHLVDSLDNETNQLFIMNLSGGETEILRFTKQYNLTPSISVAASPGTYTWSGAKSYSYRPWAGGAYGADGYIIVDSGLVDHTSTTFTARHVMGADQAQADEAEYLSHVLVELY
jgi:hypothetical protein